MINRIHYTRFKSLKDQGLDLGPANILIGPNAAGKSNVIDGFRLMAEAVRSDMETAVSRRGGSDVVVFRGTPGESFSIEMEYYVPDPNAPRSRSDMAYVVRVGQSDSLGRPAVLEEELRIKRKRNEPGRAKTWFHARLGKGVAVKDPEQATREDFDTGDPGVLALKALGFLATYPRIRALRTFIESWQFLAVSLEAVRAPRRDERAEQLGVDAANLANVLRTMRDTDKYREILDDLHRLLESIEDVDTKVERGQVLLQLREKPFPDAVEALSASDGTLRLLALLTALHQMPEHGLLCVEEPEHGLHPLVFGPLMDLIRERCPEGGVRQVVLTTHSPDLVDAAEPEETVTVERAEDGATELHRLDVKRLARWLREFRLGELWRMRQIGGVPR